jgi:hypothetical protein
LIALHQSDFFCQSSCPSLFICCCLVSLNPVDDLIGPSSFH